MRIAAVAAGAAAEHWSRQSVEGDHEEWVKKKDFPDAATATAAAAAAGGADEGSRHDPAAPARRGCEAVRTNAPDAPAGATARKPTDIATTKRLAH